MFLSRLIVIVAAITVLLTVSPVSAQTANANPYVSWYQDDAGVWRSNCTYWAWQLWFEYYGEALPSWGNAGQWADNAAYAGYPVSSQPMVGSIVMTWESWLGHVAFVEAISPDDLNTFLIREYGYAVGVEYHERWVTTDGSLVFIYPRTPSSSVFIP